MSYIKPNVGVSDLHRIQPGAQVSGLTDDGRPVTVAQVVVPFHTNPDRESEVGFEDTTGRRWFVNTLYSTDIYIHSAPRIA